MASIALLNRSLKEMSLTSTAALRSALTGAEPVGEACAPLPAAGAETTREFQRCVQALQRRVLRNPRIEIYDCGRRDIKGSRIDRRVRWKSVPVQKKTTTDKVRLNPKR